jgi:hypothetical protein
MGEEVVQDKGLRGVMSVGEEEKKVARQRQRLARRLYSSGKAHQRRPRAEGSMRSTSPLYFLSQW